MNKKIIGIGLIVIGLSVFGLSYNQGHIGQNTYSNLGCAVTEYKTSESCIIANNQMTGGFLGMILSFFTALFGVSLAVSSIPSALKRLFKK